VHISISFHILPPSTLPSTSLNFIIMAAEAKPEFTSNAQKIETPVVEQQGSAGAIRAVEAASLGLTVLAFVAGIVIAATSADTLNTYKETHLSEDFFLPLWPANFNVQPTIALVTCGTIILVASAGSLAVSNVPPLRSRTALHQITSFSAPIICLIAGIIGTSFFYGVNASTTEFSLQAWSCQWANINMSTEPSFKMLCRESEAALYLTVMIIPLEVLVLGTVAVNFLAAKKQPVVLDRKGSPTMSSASEQ